MKKIKILITFVLAAAVFSCTVDENNSLDEVANGPAPTNISGLFTITQDNSGLVTIEPRGEGVGSYNIYFGDGTEESVVVMPGKKTTHNYAEGSYDVKIVGKSVNGKTSEYIHDLDVTFVAPENLVVTLSPVAGNSFAINASAEADYEAFFEVWFGESEDETPVQFNQGEVIMHTYAAIGTYEVKVVAYSGGAATAETTQSVTITNPLLLPVNFESNTLNYAFIDFGGAATNVMDNPHSSGINTSTRVGHMQKNPPEVWAGTALVIDEIFDFSTKNTFRMKVWSPAANVPVTFKIENAADGGINHEKQVFTTVANDWEYLTFNFSDVDQTKEFSKIVLFFNLGTSGSGEDYYFDDIELISSISPLPLDFETAIAINGFGAAQGSIVANPDATGINLSANVAQMLKPSGSETWAGVAMSLIAPIDFSVQKKLKMKVWSPQAGIPVLLKIEKAGDNSVFMEKIVNTTVANGWEELTYDYDGSIDSTVDYQTVVIFFNFGVSGDGSTYYFDDIKQAN
jgi:uncharacterized protein YkuJ